MVDVTVNAPPKPQLPYDESVIPDAVKKRAAAVDALYSQQSNGSDGASQTPSETPEPSPLVSEVPAPQEPAVSPLTEPAPADTSTEIPQFLPKHEPEKPVDWERRFLRMQGQYNASQKLVGEMQEQLTQLGNEVLQLQRMPQRQAPPPPPYEQPPVYLSEQDRQNYGDELIDFTTRAAAQASQQVLGPKLQEIERQNVELQRRLAEEARQRLDQQLELAVPNFREIDRDPRWHKLLIRG